MVNGIPEVQAMFRRKAAAVKAAAQGAAKKGGEEVASAMRYLAPVDQPRIRDAVREILSAIGEDPDREGLRETPDRVARAIERRGLVGAVRALNHMTHRRLRRVPRPLTTEGGRRVPGPGRPRGRCASRGRRLRELSDRSSAL